MYVSYENRIYLLEYDDDWSVGYLKNRISLWSGLQVDQQILVFNSIMLEDGKWVKDYEIRCGDFVAMGKRGQRKNIVLDFPQVIYPKKQDYEKRRSSECGPKIKLNSSDFQKGTKIDQKYVYQNMSPSSKYGP